MKQAGVEFTADVEWSWYCNEKKDIRTDNGQGGTITHSGGNTIHTFTSSGTFVAPSSVSGALLMGEF